ncbi:MULTISPECIES: hypothetical protein [Trichocoleus]|uniref:Uncharacterized protein n=1 Tax=Trichocoleus desertorum GB2-A4 TaxID=2933944 RepID=A0ABV0JCZ7_9CYAN|nr:hypothetical protein [Trichocoleus sp. FACHB-46]MBD1864302.1 hypothetical protein [Trichocoleus sp. FACHB-46]
MQIVDGMPRRSRVDLLAPAELAIHEAMIAVENAGAHPLLTEAVLLLGQAKNKVADHIELEQKVDSSDSLLKSHWSGDSRVFVNKAD